jgi:hypothetical protein
MASNQRSQLARGGRAKVFVRMVVSAQVVITPTMVAVLVLGLSFVVWIVLGVQAGLVWSAFSIRLVSKR